MVKFNNKLSELDKFRDELDELKDELMDKFYKLDKLKVSPMSWMS